MTFYNKKLKAIIPARGGSKGVHRKNLRMINNLPLIAYPILSAKKCEHISEIYVSTEDQEIANVASSYGAKIIHRPHQYASDTSLDIDVMRHVVKYLHDEDDIVHLRATTPMIKSNIVDQAIKFFLLNSSCTGLRSAHEAPETAYKSFKKNGEYWQGLFDNEYTGDYYNLPRQSLPKTYQANGYVDIIRPKTFMNSDRLHGDKMLAFITEFVHEIDTIDDLKIVEAIYG
jgi:CMP-N,N'-diacetyllegionaminic acid synthase